MYTRIRPERGISKANLLQKEFDFENIFYAKIKKILRNLRPTLNFIHQNVKNYNYLKIVCTLLPRHS